MAVPARLIVPARHPIRLEAGAVRADSPADRRVTLHAIPLRVAPGAALESLASGLAVLKEPEWLPGMERRIAAASCRDPIPLMAVAAEDLGSVATRAVALPSVGLRRVPDDEVRRMESALALASMAIAAELACVTPLAGELAARGSGAVRGQEPAGMHPHRNRGGHGSRTSGVVSPIGSAISSHRPISGGNGSDSLLGVAAAQLYP